MPILFFIDNQQLLLWLVEFQENKTKFSIYKLLRYTTDLMEAHPDAIVIPLVLFTDRTKWRKDVLRKLETKLNDRLFLHFEYMFFKLFDFKRVLQRLLLSIVKTSGYAIMGKWGFSGLTN
jgi:hypothetical protein